MKSKLKFIIPIVIAIIAIIVAALCIDFTPQERADVSSIMSTAQKYLIESQYEQAIAEFNKVIEIEPKNVDAYLGLAEAYVGMGDTEKAIEILEKGYEITDDDRLKEMLNRLLLPTPEETTVTTTAITLEETTTTAIKTAVMPNFVGLSYEDAEVIIQENGFIVEYDEIYSSDVEKNHIISQLIPENAEITVGTTIKLTVSLGVEMVTVPDLTGLTKQEAEKLLADNNLIGVFTEEYSDTIENGIVILQSVLANENTKANSTIEVIISKGKEKIEEYFISELQKPNRDMSAYGYKFEYNNVGYLSKITEYWTENDWNKTAMRIFTYEYTDMEENKIKIINTRKYNNELTTTEYIYDKSKRTLEYTSLDKISSEYDVKIEDLKKFPLIKINSDNSISCRCFKQDGEWYELDAPYIVESTNIGMGYTVSQKTSYEHYKNDYLTGVFKYDSIESSNTAIRDINRILLEYFLYSYDGYSH